jgi:hypothetical protein
MPPLSTPLKVMTSTPLLLRTVPVAVPPDETNTPPLLPAPKNVLVALAPIAEPPAETISLPVPESIVPDAVPPPTTLSTALVLPVKPAALTNVADVTPPKKPFHDRRSQQSR